MADTSQFLNAGGAGFKLAPDLDFPSRLVGKNGVEVVTIDPSAGLATALSLTGKWAVSYLVFSGLTAETVTVELTVDGVTVWNSTFTTSDTALSLLGYTGSTTTGSINDAIITCDTSLVLRISTATDNSVNFIYLARPIL